MLFYSDMEIVCNDKLNALRSVIQDLGPQVIAFSGGVDSTFLAKVAYGVLGRNVMAVIARSPLHPAQEYEAAIKVAEKVGIECVTINTEEMTSAHFTQNPPDRCYHCKKALFSKLLDFAQKRGIPQVVEGTNFDDSADYRPGINALLELGIRSPLKEVRLTKADIRELSREMGLSTWNKPADACLASRFTYGEEITLSNLKKVEAAELYLHHLGFSQIRVRLHRDLARIELNPAEISRFPDKNLRSKVLEQLRKIGFTYVALDLMGYRTGSMNEALSPGRELTNTTK
ncbi:MAG: ATP-dependent sacrificial sulfur transferase LarE [Pseudomonadota bacterium]